MKPPNWDRIQEIYHAALALPRSERSAFVEKECVGYSDLLREVKSLLEADDSVGIFLDSPIVDLGSDNLVGRTIDGRYEVERELRPGGMGRVFVARDLQLPGRYAVIKILSQASINDAEAVKRFKREIKALTLIEHPYVVSVLGAGEQAAGKPYIAMQYIDGPTLRTEIPSNGMDVNRVASLLKQMGAALSHIHNQSVLHLDLKPENIMLQVLSDGTEMVKILDFGIAKIKDSIVATGVVNTVPIGTLLYMSPEQLRGGEKITTASDIYSMAVVACEMITGERLAASQEQRAMKPVDLPRRLSAKVQKVLLRALSFEPKNRYQSAKEFGDDLAEALLDREQDGTPPPRPLKKWLAVVSSALIVVVLSYVIYIIFRPPPPIPNNVFKYWIMVQEMRDGKEYQAPFKSNGDAIFKNGDKFQLNISTTEPGYLYIFNEGPSEPDSPSFKMIYPNRTTNNGSSSVGANQTVQSDWITFRGPAGAENFWIVWSVSPVSELESATTIASRHPQRGLIAQNLVTAKEFLMAMEAKVDSRPARYKESQETRVRGRTDVLVTLAQFQHR